MTTGAANSSSTLYDAAVLFVANQGQASCYELMREFGIGYADAVHLVDHMAEDGLIEADRPAGDSEFGSRPRKVIG